VSAQARHPQRDYGRAGLVGVCTPQANPTVEAEFRLLLPEPVGMVTSRLVGRPEAPRERLVDYLTSLGESLDAFDTLIPDLVAFACTGPSYLVGAEREAALLELEQERRGVPVISATGAIDEQLRALGARRLALIAPYPDWLGDAARAYWESRGYAIVHQARVATASADTRSIYQLGSRDARRTLAAEAPRDVDAVLLSGTGMPTLALILDHPEYDAAPVLSSNWCLVGAILTRLERAVEPDEVRRRMERAARA